MFRYIREVCNASTDLRHHGFSQVDFELVCVWIVSNFTVEIEILYKKKHTEHQWRRFFGVEDNESDQLKHKD